jgi:NADH-quinone oxidoreductase subunit H
MAKLLTEYSWLLLAIVKIAIMLGFTLQLAPIMVFAERRMAGLIQDRVGPNRATITVPGIALKGALGLPALGGAALAALAAFVLWPPRVTESGMLTGVVRGFWMAEAGALLLWSHAQLLTGFVRASNSAANHLEEHLRDLEEPRWIFYTGLIAHVFFALLYGASADPGLKPLAQAFAYGGPLLLAGVLAVIGAYAAYRIPSGPVDLRLAGIWHSIADTIKLAFKEDFIPPEADKLLHSMAPLIALFPALVTFAVIPFGDSLCFGATPEGYPNLLDILAEVPRGDGGMMCPAGSVGIEMQIADLNVGILYIFAMAGTGIVGAAIAGWSSDNKWSLLGGLRAASQMVSYEVALGLSLVGAFMVYGSPRLGDMVRWQSENAWGIFVQPVAFFLFFAAAIAEQKRTPFDAPEGESEIVAGFFLEYSSLKFVMFMTGEYIEVITSSALLVTIFLGGWSLPFVHRDGITLQLGDNVIWHAAMTHVGVSIIQILTYFGKVSLLSIGQIFIRWTVPRFRYDQIMSFGWKMLLPAAIGNLVVTGLVILLASSGGPEIVKALRLLGDVSHFVVVGGTLFLVGRFAQLLLSPIERKKFTLSSAAARVDALGGVKSGPMQA